MEDEVTTDELAILEDEATKLDDEATTLEEAGTELEDATGEDETTEDDLGADDELDEITGGGLNTVVTLISTPQPVCLITPVELPSVESRGII